MKDYLVVVHAPKAKATPGSHTYVVAEPPTVKKVQARSAESAVDTVGVRPGGHAFVVDMDHVQRFDRAEQAPLEQRRPDGNPLDQATEVAAA